MDHETTLEELEAKLALGKSIFWCDQYCDRYAFSQLLAKCEFFLEDYAITISLAEKEDKRKIKGDYGYHLE